MPFIIAQIVMLVFFGCQLAEVVKTSPVENTDQITTYRAHK
jgi:hypothetical protein